MKITWFGQSCFLFETDKISVVTDPYDPKIGITLPNDLKADIVTVSHQHIDHNNVSAVGGDPSAISTSGPVMVKGISFTGIDSFHDNEEGNRRGKNIIFIFALDNIMFAHMGDLGHVLNDEQVRQLQGVDILMIPVGGTYTVDGPTAANIVKQIRPRIVIPMHYGIKDLIFPLDPVDPFIEKMALPIKRAGVLEVTKDLLPRSPEIVLLNLTTGE